MDAFSPSVIVRLFLVALYTIVCAIVYWRLIPRLSPMAKRLATAMLAAQVLAITLALELRLVRQLTWILSMTTEYNIPTALATTQLALAGVIALAASGLGRAMPLARRRYLVALAAVLLFMALDEFLSVSNRFLENGRYVYIVLGAVFAMVSGVYARREPRHAKIWYICLLAGLAIAATGELLLSPVTSSTCNRLGFKAESKCFLRSVAEWLEFLGIWLVLISALSFFTDVAPTPSRRTRLALVLLPLALFAYLMLFSLFVRGRLDRLQIGIKQQYNEWSFAHEYRAHAWPTAIQLNYGIQLTGVGFSHEQEAIHFRLFVSNPQEQCQGLGFSIHLVDQEFGKSVASLDRNASCRYSYKFTDPDGNKIYRQLMSLSIPPQLPTNRALWIVLTAWRALGDGFAPFPIVSSDRQLLSDTQVVLGELVLPRDSIAAAANQLASFDHGLTLEDVHLPAKAHVGDTLSIPFSWSAETDGLEDYTQFLHFFHEEHGGQWVYDQQPLGARLPTRLWYRGLADTEIWQAPIPDDLAPGTYTVFTGLYRPSDLKRLTARDAAGESLTDDRVPLGSVTIEGT